MNHLSAPSLVEWCEGVTHPHALNANIAEAANTSSNLVFVLVGLFGLRRQYRRHRSRSNSGSNSTSTSDSGGGAGVCAALVFTEAALVVVGLGSMWFHAQRTYLGELLDELPMSLLAVGYHACLDGLHWSTRGVSATTTTTTTTTTTRNGMLA